MPVAVMRSIILRSDASMRFSQLYERRSRLPMLRHFIFMCQLAQLSAAMHFWVMETKHQAYLP